MRRGITRGGHSNLPVPKASRGSPGNSKSLGRGGNFAHSAEDIPQRVQNSYGTPSPHRRAVSPGDQRRGLSVHGEQGGQSGVRYITEDLIKKIAKEDALEMITNLNLTLAKEGGKKIKYIENLDKLKKLQQLNLSNNMIEKIEKVDKCLKLRELNLSYNIISKIEGLENLMYLQVLNLTGNKVTHIPIWLAKRLRALRTLHLGKNNLQSLSELAKLKPLPDLTQLTVAENPVAQLPHYRQYLVFHLRTLEVLDSQPVTERDRQMARDRFEQDELERLEKQVEEDDSRLRKLEEEKNLSAHESSLLKAQQDEYLRQQRMSMDKMKDMERELAAKDELLKKKTSELNKACEKHYQLEQELAFFKIDSKFDSLGKSPSSFHTEGDDSGGLGESPYIGRARYKANQYTRDSDLSGSPQQHPGVHSLPSPQRAEVMERLHTQLDSELAKKQDRVQKTDSQVKQTEDRLKRLQDDLMGTERKLLQATKDLKRMGDIPDKDDIKVQIRQRMAKKMQLVNELRDSATQIEEEIDKTKNSMHQNKVDVARLKGQLERLDTKDPKYRKVYAEMVDKEQQISESNQMYGQLNQQLEVMLDTIARETEDIKKLEVQLNDDRIESNESIRTELDEIVGGLQGYLSHVKTKGQKVQRDYEVLLGEKMSLEDQCRKLEQELSVLDSEAGKVPTLEQRLMELEDSLSKHQDMNRTLEDQIHRNRSKDAEYQDKMETTAHELQEMRKALKDAERKVNNDRQQYERQVQTERERAERAMREARDKSHLEDEIRKLQSQLNNTMAQLSDKDRKLNDAIPNPELRKRLKDLTQTVKSGRSPISPQNDRDVLGKTFKDLQQYMHDSANKSLLEVEQMKKNTSHPLESGNVDAEIQTLRENLKKAENKLQRRAEKDHSKDEKLEAERKNNKELLNEIHRLKDAYKDLENKSAQGRPIMKIVYRPESETDSLNSEEKALYDELQRELLELRRNMRVKENENAKQLANAENEAAMLEQMVRDHEEELAKTREENELEKEKYEARMQVIAQDLEQAQTTADQLKYMLDERDAILHGEVQSKNMNNQMISSQEAELTKLYDILEAQRQEIDHLNHLLDNLAAGGSAAAGPVFDDELWKLRQEVNRLKETLAMQSAYVQSMPKPQGVTSAHASTGMGPSQYHGQASGPTSYTPVLTQQHGAPMGIMPGAPMGLMPGAPMGSMPGAPMGSMPGAPMGSIPGARGTMGAMNTVPGGYGSHQPGIGADRGEARMPHGGRPAGRSRSTEGRLTQGARHSSRGGTGDSDPESVRSHRSGRSRHGRSGRERTRSSRSKTAFEPVHKPQAYKPVQTTGVYPLGVVNAGQGPQPQPSQNIPGYHPATGSFHGSLFPQGVTQARGVSQTPGYAGTQTPGYGSTQTPGHDGTQTFGYGTNSGIAAGATHTPGVHGTQTSYPVGQISYLPVAANPVQSTGSGMRYLPAYSTSPERPAGRIYYPPGGAPPPPPPPPSGSTQYGPPSPGPRVTFLPLAPVAAGTPVKGRAPDGSMTVPPSPIVAGSISMDGGQPRGILKNADTGGDDTYLFCNVPEHHDLEDYVAELQEKLRKMKTKLARDEELQRQAEEEDDNRLIRRLRGELEQRRDELEGLDLAIDKQKKCLKDLKKEEKFLENERIAARDELHFMKHHNARESKKRRLRANVFEESFTEEDEIGLAGSRRKFLRNEIDALERTLAKRRNQLQDADKLLRVCSSDLQEAKEEARQTVEKYDMATESLQNTVKETGELEKRANQAGVELIKASDTLRAIRAEVKDMERKQAKQERLLRDINQVTAKKDAEYKDLDSRIKSATQNLHKLHGELTAAAAREKETVSALNDAEEVLSKRRADIARMNDQIDQQKQELERLDQKMGKKRTEFQILQDSLEKKSTELTSVLREAEAECASRQREAKDYKEKISELEMQKNELLHTLKIKRNELHKRKEEVETEDEVLQKLINSVNKNKSELQHIFDMQKIEKHELDSLKSQHAQKLAELEKTQRELLEERSQLDQLSAETNRKSAEVDRLRQILDRDRQEVERLAMEKQSLEDRLTAMSREKDLMDDSTKTLDNKINQMRRAHRSVEEKLDSSTKRLENVESELRHREKELEESNHQRAQLQKEVHALRTNAKDCKSELKTMKDHIRDSEDQRKSLDQDLKDIYLKRDEAKLEYERLNEGIRQSRIAHDDYMRQEKVKQSELQELLKNVNDKSIEYQEAKMALNKVRKEVEREESKLNKLVTNANLELENIRSDLQSKQLELEQATFSVSNLKKESEKLHVDEVKFMELDKQIKSLEKEILDRNEEKNELAKALSRSYEELQKARTASAQEQERMTRERLELENALHDIQTQLEQAKQEMKQMQNRTSHQVTELQNLAEIQFGRANRLGDELNKIRKDNKDMRKKLLMKNQLNEIEKESEDCLNSNIGDQDNNEKSENDPQDADIIDQHLANLQNNSSQPCHEMMSDNKENINNEGGGTVKENIKGKMTEEQDLLRHQLQEQMRRHAEAMEHARLQSEGTIESLRQKMNALQDVLVSSGEDSNTRLSLIRKRARSSSPGKSILDTTIVRGRQRSKSPTSRRSYLAQRPRSRSRSYERSHSPLFPERDLA
ncbi:centriolin-like isoform X6 [Ostrea edulis]|uniref:centriolin-like isoform X6 n=1 Tax=Ostrea edulis TaxID=37623 RepID=UPI0024AFC69C|nr:centriolin-like isoform X6 [Ostrea edulis]